MMLAYGYDLKEDDKILEAPVQVANILTPLMQPRAALVNHLPLCAVSNFILAILALSHSHFQCGTFLPGSHILATSHWHGLLGN
jgi:hypothetical protein